MQSTGGMVTQLLDFVRSLGVSFDEVSDRIVDRVLHRGRRRPVAPVLLGGSSAEVVDATPSLAVSPCGALGVKADPPATSLAGNYAGPVTRLAAYVIDAFASVAAYGLDAQPGRLPLAAGEP